MIHAVAYLRCSSEKQAEKEASIPAQRAEIERAAAREGAVVTRWFTDDGISAKNTDDRPALAALLDYIDANKGSVDVAYVYDFRRMARNREDAYFIRKAIRVAGVRLVALTQPSVEDEGANALLMSVYDGVAEMERLYLARVVRRGQRQALVDGWWPYPRPPFGFRSVGEANARGARRLKLVPDPVTSEVVKRVFALYLAGNGSKIIASTLDREGVRPPSREDAPKQLVQGWRPKHVKSIIENHAVYGAATWEDEVVNENHHPAIVTREVWEEAQRLAKARARTPSELSSLNTSKSEHGLFRPWLRCGSCGGTMALNRGGQAGNRIAYYACSSRLMNNNACVGLTVRADDLDAALLATIEAEVLTPDRIRAMVLDTFKRMEEDAGGELRERRATLEARIANLSQRLQRLAAAIADGSMDLQDVSALSSPLRKQREEAREELAALPEPKPIPEAIDPEVFRATITDCWRHPDVTVSRKALDRIVNEIRLEPGKATIRYSFKAEPSGYTYQDPSGPPYTPKSAREPSGSVSAGSPASMQPEPPVSV